MLILICSLYLNMYSYFSLGIVTAVFQVPKSFPSILLHFKFSLFLAFVHCRASDAMRGHWISGVQLGLVEARLRARLHSRILTEPGSTPVLICSERLIFRIIASFKKLSARIVVPTCSPNFFFQVNK